jgi:hypothetical protein
MSNYVWRSKIAACECSLYLALLIGREAHSAYAGYDPESAPAHYLSGDIGGIDLLIGGRIVSMTASPSSQFSAARAASRSWSWKRPQRKPRSPARCLFLPASLAPAA